MSIDLSKVRAGDKVLLRDGSKIVVDDRGGRMKPMVLTQYLTVWGSDGKWSPLSTNNPFDIVGVIFSGDRQVAATNPNQELPA